MTADLPQDRLDATNALIEDLCRSSPSEGREMARRLPDWTRAQLALFCYARGHLRDVGLAVAGVCSEESLVRAGGHAGLVLFERSQKSDERSIDFVKPHTKPVTLARGSADRVPPAP